ncbi:MAG: hypothetical protein KAZ87_01140 [Spirochaetes bacterium]|nr:hypothetical protein [Spirochaetota bacterium]
MFWLFVVYSIFSRHIREIVLRDEFSGGLLRPIVLLVLPVAVIAVIFGLYKLYKWAINTSIVLFSLCMIVPLLNFYLIGVLNYKIEVIILVIEMFNILSLVYLIKPANRKYFAEFVKEKDLQKSMRKISK